MTAEKLKSLLEAGAITQEEFDAITAAISEPAPELVPDPEPKPGIDDSELERIIQAKVDKITAKLGKEKSELQKQLEKLKKDKLTDEERAALEMSEREAELAEREKALAEKENRLYAIKAIKAAGLDDGSDKSLELVEFVLADDEAAIDARVKAFGELVKKFASGEIDRKFKDSGRNPAGGAKAKPGSNPYAKESYNLTEQMRLEVEDPELAKSLKASAGIK